MHSHRMLYFLLVLTTAVIGCSGGPTSSSPDAVNEAQL